MGAERLIVEAAVARLWRVHPNRLFYWRKEGRFDSDEREKANHGHTHYYKLSTLDTLHASWARGFPPGIAIPTTKELLAFGGHGLLKRNEAIVATGKTNSQLGHCIRDRLLPFFEISPGRVLRFPAAALALAISSDSGLVSQETARRILLLEGVNAIDVLSHAGLLEREHKHGVREWQVNYNSLLALLNQQLNRAVTAEEWRQRNLAEARPPLSKLQMSHAYRVGYRAIEAEIAADRLPAIRTAGGWTLIPQWAADEFAERRNAWSAEQVAALLGVPVETAADFIDRKALCNKRHGSAVKIVCPSAQCLREYITVHRTDDSITTEEWFTRSISDGAIPILDDELLAGTVGAEIVDIREAITNGSLRGVHLPPIDGKKHIALVRSDAVVWRRMQERALRTEYE